MTKTDAVRNAVELQALWRRESNARDTANGAPFFSAVSKDESEGMEAAS